jgi:hypothetical protein
MHRKRYKNVGCQKQTLQKTLPASTSVGMLYAMEIAANRTAVRSSRYPPPLPPQFLQPTIYLPFSCLFPPAHIPVLPALVFKFDFALCGSRGASHCGCCCCLRGTWLSPLASVNALVQISFHCVTHTAMFATFSHRKHRHSPREPLLVRINPSPTSPCDLPDERDRAVLGAECVVAQLPQVLHGVVAVLAHVPHSPAVALNKI